MALGSANSLRNAVVEGLGDRFALSEIWSERPDGYFGVSLVVGLAEAVVELPGHALVVASVGDDVIVVGRPIIVQEVERVDRPGIGCFALLHPAHGGIRGVMGVFGAGAAGGSGALLSRVIQLHLPAQRFFDLLSADVAGTQDGVALPGEVKYR